MRRLYTLLLYLALPLASLIVAVRGLRDRGYWRGWRERFGFGPASAGGGLWVHAVSVGEVQAAAVLIEALRAHHAGDEIVLTCATPTGRERGRALLPEVQVRFGPYDLPGCVRRCLRALRPRLLIVLETELWPNLLHESVRARVPVLIASARVSARSAALFRRVPGLLRAALLRGVWVAAQTEVDARRYAALGVPPARLSIGGNVKFDRALPADIAQRGARLRAQFAGARPVWIAGSSHAGEEPVLLEAHRRLLERYPDALLILAPRHPPRFDAAAAAAATAGLSCRRRTAGPTAEPFQVLLLDTLGELIDFYAAADVAFVGGSLVPVGGHNLLEPAALALPVLTGPAQFNSPEAARTLRERGALMVVHDAGELASALLRLLADPQARARQGAAARAAIEANRGALERLVVLIDWLPRERAA